MAPQNLNQVFFNNVTNAAIQSATGAYTAVTGTPAEIGVWDVDAGDWLATALTGKKRIQIVQGMPTGNPISTPIIDVANIVRINYKVWADMVPTRATQTIDAGGAPTSTKDVMLRIALRTSPTAYANYYQDGTAVDLSGGGYEFPLLGNFSAGRMIFNIEVGASVHGGSETTLITALYNAIIGNKTFNALFSATDNGTSGLVLTARHYGVEFDVTCQYSDKSGALGTVTASRTNATSNYAIALSDEKSQRARYGNFNRMYFPFNFPTFAQSGFKYDVIDIQYKHDWPSSTGIARAGELNTVRIYWGKSSTALSAATDAANTAADTVFGVTIGTSSEQLF
jgi:hypothetical protein